MLKHLALDQGTPEWHAARCGLLTASEMKLIITPTLKIASNEKERAHLYELLAQRITGYVEPSYYSDDMARGHEEESAARNLYATEYEAVSVDVGFITNDKWGFTIGYSPDGLVGDDGQIECKSRRQKYQVQTIVENIAADGIPPEFMIQVQTGLLVSERAWCDYITYCGGLPMAKLRCYPQPEIQDAILAAATDFEARIRAKRIIYEEAIEKLGAIPTERTIYEEIAV